MLLLFFNFYLTKNKRDVIIFLCVGLGGGGLGEWKKEKQRNVFRHYADSFVLCMLIHHSTRDVSREQTSTRARKKCAVTLRFSSSYQEICLSVYFATFDT